MFALVNPVVQPLPPDTSMHSSEHHQPGRNSAWLLTSGRDADVGNEKLKDASASSIDNRP